MHDNTTHGHLQAKVFWSNLAQHPAAAASPVSPAIDKKSLPPKKPTKRIRISTACVNCRHKKIKCDGNMPCAHCEKFRTECTYPVATKPANQEYVETLENRLRSVESHLQGLLSRGWGRNPSGDLGPELVSDEADSASPHTPGSLPATPPSKPIHAHSHSHSEVTGRYSNALPPLTRHFSGASLATPNLTGNDSSPESEEPAFATDDSIEVLSLLMGSLKVERDGAAQFLPKVTDQREHSYSDSRVYDPTSGSNDASDFSALDWESIDFPLPYTLPGTLLTPKAIGTLLDIYFNSVHTFLPVIHKSSFLTLCQEGQYRVPPFLLMSICAVAARHATDFELQEIPELTSLKGHHALYDHARALLDTYMDVPRLSTVQGLLLLAYYQIKEKRSGHFFRIRMYVNLATRMALDMGLHRALRKSLKDLESTLTGDSFTGSGGANSNQLIRPSLAASSQYAALLYARQNGHPQTGSLATAQDRDVQGSRYAQVKRSVLHQENRLAWLGCFFLDGLTSSLMGQEYCVTNSALDMRKLIQEASQMTDTVQGATLIFWYHHLELVQIYRRICVFYRSVPNERVLTQAVKSPDMHSIESSLESWLLNLPAHLVYVDNQAVNGAALPSYYTLYLHRFFYSHKLLLYRPLISNKVHRGDIKDVNSPMAKCSQAALMLTQIGEIIFQNYSWPWPGCGLFAYHMLQAAEIHVFQMVTQQTTSSQSLYYRTMDLIKGYVSLAKLPALEKDVAAMEEMVNNFLLTPQGAMTQSGNASTLQQQQQQQSFVATPASDYSYAGVMSPASPAESVARMSLSHNNLLHQSHPSGSGNNNGTQNHEDTDMFSPLQTHAYPSFESASRIFRATTTAAATAPGYVQDTNAFSMGFGIPGSTQAPTSSSSAIYDPNPGTLPFYGAVTTTASSIFGSNNSCIPSNGNNGNGASSNNNVNNSHQGSGLTYGQPSFMQPSSTPVGDLLGLGPMSHGSNGGNNNSNGAHPIGQGSLSSPFSTMGASAAGMGVGTAGNPLASPVAAATAATLSPGLSAEASGLNGAKKKTVPPPKPPKRILPQSTGSSSSSSMSQSGKPPVPKKPVRLSEIAPAPATSPTSFGLGVGAGGAAGQPRSIAPRPDSKLAPLPLPVPLVPTSSSPEAYYSSMGGNGTNSTIARTEYNVPPPAYPGHSSPGESNGNGGPTAGASVPGAGRSIKSLQSQATLYGMGALVNSLGVDQQIHSIPEGDQDQVTIERYYEGHESALHYLQMNPHLYDQIPPQNRRPLI